MKFRDYFRAIFDWKFAAAVNYSFSQEGEDMILDNLLDFKPHGFYVDFGAYNPYRFSNTQRFYERGWHGINVDATPGSMKFFDKVRKRDINLECALAESEGSMKYYRFNEPALNTFDGTAVASIIDSGYKLISTDEVKTISVTKLLEKYVQDNQIIDFIDIDIEGYDEVIIESINWNKYRPTFVLTEKKVDERSNAMCINHTLVDAGYFLVACTGRTAIYQLGKV